MLFDDNLVFSVHVSRLHVQWELNEVPAATQQRHLHHDSVRAVGLVQTNKAGCTRGRHELTAGMHFWEEADFKALFCLHKRPIVSVRVSPLLFPSHPPFYPAPTRGLWQSQGRWPWVRVSWARQSLSSPAPPSVWPAENRQKWGGWHDVYFLKK